MLGIGNLRVKHKNITWVNPPSCSSGQWRLVLAPVIKYVHRLLIHSYKGWGWTQNITINKNTSPTKNLVFQDKLRNFRLGCCRGNAHIARATTITNGHHSLWEPKEARETWVNFFPKWLQLVDDDQYLQSFWVGCTSNVQGGCNSHEPRKNTFPRPTRNWNSTRPAIERQGQIWVVMISSIWYLYTHLKTIVYIWLVLSTSISHYAPHFEKKHISRMAQGLCPWER